MRRKANGKHASWTILSACALILLFSLSVQAQEAKNVLFQEADEALAQAKAAEAQIYSPGHFESGMKYYKEASNDYESGRTLEAIGKKLNMASVYFLKSVETAKLADTHIKSCISARKDALEAEAPKFRNESWNQAEESFRLALKTLEQGFLDEAKSKASKAEELFRQVEMESIKANYLDETKTLLKEAKNRNVKRRAPETLQRAETLAEKAEKLLEENKYDTDEARQIAQEARYEAQHALYLAEAIQKLENDNRTVESVFLENEALIQNISDEFDLNARFQNGVGGPVEKIIAGIQSVLKENGSLKQDLADRNDRLADLNKDLEQIRSQLGNLKTEKADLSKVMEEQKQAIEKQKQAKETFERVQNMFTQEEATILRTGSDVIIRLYGLTFPVGKATIESQYFGLLAKLIKAADEYPRSTLTIEGHTDAWGSDEANQKLSTERAVSVRDYLLATAAMDSARIAAVGYGEEKPIASNETAEGRRKNRRIEIAIKPLE